MAYSIVLGSADEIGKRLIYSFYYWPMLITTISQEILVEGKVTEEGYERREANRQRTLQDKY